MKKVFILKITKSVVFKDMSNGDVFLSRSTCNTRLSNSEVETYPLVKVKSPTPLTRSTGKSSWLLLPVVLISS